MIMSEQLTAEQTTEILQLIAEALKAIDELGNATAYVNLIQEWMQTNAPSYLD
jgi:hypothetical protein